MLTMTVSFSLLIAFIAFAAEFIDSSLGMGYGTALTPILLLMGFDLEVVVPSVLLSEFFTGFVSALLHQKAGNVTFFQRHTDIIQVKSNNAVLRPLQKLRLSLSRPAKVAGIIGLFGLAATLIAVRISLCVPKIYIKIYIAVMILAVGIVILLTKNKKMNFSWAKISGLGLLAAFNKGISGGGYGPVITGGQVLAGMDAKAAVAVTSLTEGFICLVGVCAYTISSGFSGLVLAPYLVIGALLSTPLSAYTIKRIQTGKFKIIIGIVTICLGTVSILKILI